MSDEPEFEAIKDKKTSGGKKFGDLTLAKATGVQNLDLRKGIQIERRNQYHE